MKPASSLRFVLLALLTVVGLDAHGQSLVAIEATPLPDLPDPSVDGPLLGDVDGRAVVLGGWTDDSDSASWSRSSWVLEDDAARWQPLQAEGLVARANAAVLSIGGSILLAGGIENGSWTASVSELRETAGGLASHDLPALPVALERPTGTSSGQTATIAGFTGGPDPPHVRIFRLDLASVAPEWEELDAPPIGGGDVLALAVQDGGLNVAVSNRNGSGFSHFRHTPLEGWVEKSKPVSSITAITAMALGQAHVAYVSPGPSSGYVTWSYSVITDTWSEIGELPMEAAGPMSMAPVGSSFLVAQSVGQDRGTRISRIEFSVGKRHFYWLDYATVLIYLLSMVLIGVYFSKRESGTEDFFVGGRKMPWWAVGFSLYATGTSAISFMAIPAKSYATDWLYLAQNVIGFVAIIPVALIIVPLIRRLNLTTTYEYLEMRFHVVIRLMGSVLNMTYQLGARMSVVLFLPALALSAVTGVDVVTSIVFMGIIATAYTVLGGIKAVIWTDVVQVVVLLGGAFLCLFIIVANTDGGVGGLLSIAAADSKMHMFDWRFDLTLPTMWLFLILATADTITWPKDQVMVQRVLSTKSAKEAGKSVWTLVAIVAPGSFLFFTLGTALYAFYKVNPDRLSPLLDLDATFPFFIAAELPVGVAGLIIAALFAASMSTLDSSMNSVATIIVVDFYQRFKKGVSDARSLRLAKWITVATGVFGTGFALVLSRYSLPSLWDTFIMLTGLLGGGFGGVYALGMFTRRANWQGALVGIVASIFATLAVRAYTDIHVLLYVGVAVITCVVVGYLVSLFFPIQHERLHGLTVFQEDRAQS